MLLYLYFLISQQDYHRCINRKSYKAIARFHRRRAMLGYFYAIKDVGLLFHLLRNPF